MSSEKTVKLPSFLSKKWCKIPHVSVSSVSEYFALPKETREWYGLYKLPFALPWEWTPNYPGELGWDAFYEKIKKEYPVQYFFRHWLSSFDNPVYAFFMRLIYWPVQEARTAIKFWLTPVHPRWRNCLPRHSYSDITELLVTSNFALIQDFYWEEVVDGHVNWQGTEIHKKFYTELKEYVDWIEQEKPKLEKKHMDLLSKASNIVGDYQTKYKEPNDLEESIRNKETEILIWFANNRAFFWT